MRGTMKILLTNDDGIFAPGIAVLARELLSCGHEVTIAAPHVENSGKSHAITFRTPLKVEKIVMEELGVKGLKVYGTPADCVRAAVHLHPEPFDFCFSGINAGYNAATNVLYSGTVSAAIEANLFGIPAMAVSTKLQKTQEGGDCKFQDTARLAMEVFEQIKENKEVEVYNLNTPYLSYEEMKGLRICKVGADVMSRYDITEDGTEYSLYLRGFPKDNRKEEDSDIVLLHQGYATLSPLLYDVTNREIMEKLRESFSSMW